LRAVAASTVSEKSDKIETGRGKGRGVIKNVKMHALWFQVTERASECEKCEK